MTLYFILFIESLYKRPVKEKQALQHHALEEDAIAGNPEKSHRQVKANKKKRQHVHFD